MRVTIEPTGKGKANPIAAKVSVEVDDAAVEHIADALQWVVKPALMAYGFGQKLVDEFIPTEGN